DDRGFGRSEETQHPATPSAEIINAAPERSSSDPWDESHGTGNADRPDGSPPLRPFLPILITSRTREEPMLSQAVTAKDIELYFKHFHHRWPLLHRDSFNECGPYTLTASVAMIGAWLSGSHEAQERSLILHDRLMEHILQRLKVDEKISRAVLMRNVLVSVLREVGFFEPEQVSAQEKPGTFPAFLHLKQQERRRLATCLFRIDCYLSLLRVQPPLLTSEELYFALPCTFATWDAENLSMWSVRIADEPLERQEHSTCETLRGKCLDEMTGESRSLLLLAEDVQLAFCATYWDIWHYREHSRNSSSADNDLQDAPRKRLESWSRYLECLFIRHSADEDQNILSGQHIVPMKFYLGQVDESADNWQDAALNRFCSIKFDALILYNSLSLHLLTDIRVLRVLAQNSAYAEGALLDVQYEQKTKQWAQRRGARQAVWHAVTIIRSLRTSSEYLAGTLDPVCHLALAVATLVIWAYTSYSNQPCDQCGLHLESYLGSVTEIMPARSQAWIEAGGRAAIDGIVLCRCNTEKLLDRIRATTTAVTGNHEWQAAALIAPFPRRTEAGLIMMDI
ncbi:MAG: hypothetical protein M1818_005986, partial [Claussenomyces sp. TS43310]